MRNLVILSFALFTLTISSCKKDTPNNPGSGSNNLYIKFTLDGTPVDYESTSCSINTGFGGGSYTSSGFFDTEKDISIGINIPQDTIRGADLTALIGQKIEFYGCGGCPTNADMIYSVGLGGDDYRTDQSLNTLPNQYLKLNTVTFSKTINSFGKNVGQYIVTGEFNANLNYGSTIKSATNGTFKLVFQEAYN